jgi:hypothetical protein
MIWQGTLAGRAAIDRGGTPCEADSNPEPSFSSVF